MTIERCVNDHGKIFSWDSETKEIVEIIIKEIKPVDIRTCSTNAVNRLIAQLLAGAE